MKEYFLLAIFAFGYWFFIDKEILKSTIYVTNQILQSVNQNCAVCNVHTAKNDFGISVLSNYLGSRAKNRSKGGSVSVLSFLIRWHSHGSGHRLGESPEPDSDWRITNLGKKLRDRTPQSNDLN
jgi:hypothetical protein